MTAFEDFADFILSVTVPVAALSVLGLLLYAAALGGAKKSVLFISSALAFVSALLILLFNGGGISHAFFYIFIVSLSATVIFIVDAVLRKYEWMKR